MKTWLLASSMLLGLGAVAPAMAQNVVTDGYIGGAYGQANVDVSVDGLGSVEGDGDAWKVDGAFATPLGTDFGLQIDGEYLRLEGDGDDADVLTGTAHIFKAGEGGAYGAFASLSDAEDVGFWSVGAEAQAYFDRATLQAQLGYGQVDDLDEADFWAARGEARFFATDNLRFDVVGGLTRLSADDVDVDLVNYGVGAEYQFDALPISLFATYDRAEYDEDGVDLDADTVFVGVRYTFGGGSLKARDRQGARWTSASKLFGGGLGSAALAGAGAIDDDLGGGEGNDFAD